MTPLSCSYDAAEDNELTFREGDKIVEIEAASDDWWQGKDAAGNVGLFPGEYHHVFVRGSGVDRLAANYVEVQE